MTDHTPPFSLKGKQSVPVLNKLGVKYLSNVLCTIENLPFDTTEEKILQLLSGCQGVIRVMVFVHPHRVAYVEFDDSLKSYQMEQFNGYQMAGWDTA